MTILLNLDTLNNIGEYHATCTPKSLYESVGGYRILEAKRTFDNTNSMVR